MLLIPDYKQSGKRLSCYVAKLLRRVAVDCLNELFVAVACLFPLQQDKTHNQQYAYFFDWFLGALGSSPTRYFLTATLSSIK